MWSTATIPECCNAFVNRRRGAAADGSRCCAPATGSMSANPTGRTFIRDLIGASPEFARLWAQQDVAAHSTRHKIFRMAAVGEVRMSATNLTSMGMPEGGWWCTPRRTRRAGTDRVG
nr:hypothetical protein [Streptomyces sp. 846.5]